PPPPSRRLRTRRRCGARSRPPSPLGRPAAAAERPLPSRAGNRPPRPSWIRSRIRDRAAGRRRAAPCAPSPRAVRQDPRPTNTGAIAGARGAAAGAPTFPACRQSPTLRGQILSAIVSTLQAGGENAVTFAETFLTELEREADNNRRV